MIGQVLGTRYEIESLLGQGGMAQVYLARDLVLGRPVAVKVLRSEYSNDSALVARFQREARAAANLVHPNIVAVYDVGQDSGRHYIVMEYAPGSTLKEIIRQRAPLPVEYSLRVAEEVCAALEYAHRSGVIHRDIKPQNILLSEDEEVVKVADFGIAKSQLDPETTADRLAMGTVKYISPEQARGVEVVPGSDLYSLGVVLYEMLTGEQPFDGDTPVSIALQHVEVAPRPPRRLNPYLPPAVEGIILRALAKNPQDRFASAREMRQSLEQYRLVGIEATGPLVYQAAAPPVPPAHMARPSTAAPGDVPSRSPYAIPRRPMAVARRSTLGPIGIILLVLIALSIIALVVLVTTNIDAFKNTFLPPVPTATPTLTPTPTMPPQVPVPDVTGYTAEEARIRLEQFGLYYQEGDPRFDPYTEPGRVVAQEPPHGVYVEQGSPVTVFLGAKPGLAQVPNVVQMSFQGARLKLEEAGFRVQREEVGCTSTQTGFVDRQDPRGGLQDIQGITVTVYVSIGDMAVMPELLRVPLEEAIQRIEEAGLSLRFVNAQTQANMPPGVDIDDQGAPGQVISYQILIGGVLRTSGSVFAGDHVPCRAPIDIAYYARP